MTLSFCLRLPTMPLFSWGNSSHAASVEARQKRCTHIREAYLTQR